jgi:hypothetical protein
MLTDDDSSLEREKLEFEAVRLRVDVWKKTVDVQQHFNDLELRIRSFAVTVLTAVLGLTGFAIKEKIFVSAGDFQTPLAAWLVGVALVAWSAFYFMDRWWYHRLLLGAVIHGAKLEKGIGSRLPDTMGLGEAISEASPFYLAGWKVRSSTKIDLFYGGVALILVVAMIVLHVSIRPEGAAQTTTGAIVKLSYPLLPTI